MKKGQISNLLRQFRLIYFTDWIRFHIQRFQNRKTNRAFRSQHPDVDLPPDYLMYESFQINYHKYYTESANTAQWLVDHLQQHIDLQYKRILDWGCGPGRIIRHLPAILRESNEYHGTDYNEQSIEWCKAHLKNIQFNHNNLTATLPYPDAYFDVIYGISIFTHLSKEMHEKWYAELYRMLKPEGIFFLTTQGDPFRVKLTHAELQQYAQGELIVRGKVKEGHRTYSAFHPTAFMEKLFENATILEHIVPTIKSGRWLPQDIWIVRK